MKKMFVLAAVAALTVSQRVTADGKCDAVARETMSVRPGGATDLAKAKVRFSPVVFYPGWISREAKGGWRPEPDGSRRWQIPAKDYNDNEHPLADGCTSWSAASDGSVDLSCTIKPLRKATVLAVALVGSLPNDRYAGGTLVADAREVAIPDVAGKTFVFRDKVKALGVRDKKGDLCLTLEFPRETEVLLQDNRTWRGNSFSLRLFLKGGKGDVVPGEDMSLSCKVRSPLPIGCETKACRIEAGKEWIPMEEAFDVEPGSALDFTDIGGTGRPAGKYGRPVVRNGHFEFENLPGKAQRFYGVNFVGGSNYPEERYAKPFAATLARLGYNAVRMHHHDQGISGGRDGALDEKTMARFDAFIAALIENGLYVTTDFYVSRKPAYRDCGIDRDGRFEKIDVFKRVAMFHEGTFQNYLRHARALLSHVNPHTGRRYADEPALGWISLVNEGTLGASGFDWMKECRDDVLAKWKDWLTARKAADPRFASVPETIPEKPRDFASGDPAHKNAFLLFLVDVERAFARRVTTFVRDEMGCKALLTNMNYGFKCPAYQKLIVDEYDYMDDHFYVDHPHFLEKKWRLPSQLENANTFQRKTCGAMYPVTRRIFGKPFVISEYNYSGPGRYRGVGGIATGAMAALQDWDGLWRFAWSHGDAGVKGPKAMTYFDMSGDPLGLASERASMCLFLRRDVEPYGNAIAYHVDRATADSPQVRQLEIPTDWRPAGWWAKVGCRVGEREPADMEIAGRAARGDRVETAPARPDGLLRPIVADPDNGSFRIETPRTAGGFAEGGEILAGTVTAKLDGPATVWASSLDGRPIGSSGRLLVTHLTDVQNAGITYADSSKRILLDWGRLPHLMRTGVAQLSIALTEGAWSVYALSPTGKRREAVSAVFRDGRLRFTADVARDPGCATYLYELVRTGEAKKTRAGGCKFLLMSDIHVESDFLERGKPVYTCWQPGDHAALVKTYEFVNADPACRDVQFALFCGDQINTGYTSQQKFLDDEMKTYERTLEALDLHAKSKGADLSAFKFRTQPYVCRENLGKGVRPISVTPPPLGSRVIAIQGNHDTGCPGFYRDCAFQCGGVRFITFFASYVALPAPKGKYRSTAKISDETLAFVEREMAAAAADPEIRHIVLVSHWSIGTGAPQTFGWPILDACKENGFSDNRKKLLGLCEKYGCALYLNGHEHRTDWPYGKVGGVTDVNCGTATDENAAFAVVEIADDVATFGVYGRAVVRTKEDGGLETLRQPRLVRTFSIRMR